MAEMVPLIEAAKRRGVSVDAIRRRIQRGTIPAEKRGDRWYVEAPDIPDIAAAQDDAYDAPSSPPPVPDSVVQAMIAMQRQMNILVSELAVKNQQLAEAATERAELRRLLGNEQQTVQLLTEGAHSAAPEPPRTVVDAESSSRAGSDDSGAAQVLPQRRSWWRRLWEG